MAKMALAMLAHTKVAGKELYPTLSNPTQEKVDLSGILFVQRAEASFFVRR
jgi:hypothetical protein